MHATGFAFDVRRRYSSGAQAEAFQYMLDRLQALNLIAWTRDSRIDPHHGLRRLRVRVRVSPSVDRLRASARLSSRAPGRPHASGVSFTYCLISRSERRKRCSSKRKWGRCSSSSVRRMNIASTASSTSPCAVCTTTDMCPAVWPGVKAMRTLPSPKTSKERAKPENEFASFGVEVDEAVVEAVVELALHVAVARAAVGGRLPLGGGDEERGLREVRDRACVIGVEVGHDHRLHARRLDALLAQLRRHRLLGPHSMSL